MTQVVPTTIFDMDTGNSTDNECPEVITSGKREGEVCGRDVPCRFHD